MTFFYNWHIVYIQMEWTESSANCRLWKGLLELVILLQIGLPSTLLAAPAPLVLRCEINQGGETLIGDFARVTDPYSVEAIDINGKFRFKAVVIGDEHHIEHIKIYTYYREQHQVVLLHEARYMPPFEPNQSSFAALTGVNYLYSPSLEQELQYGCTLLEVQPVIQPAVQPAVHPEVHPEVHPGIHPEKVQP